MGERTKTWQDYYSDETLIDVDDDDHFCAMCDRLANVLVVLGLGFPPDQPFNDFVKGLSKALNRFAGNAKLWRPDMSYSEALLLQRHLCFTLLVPGGKASRARIAVDRLAAAVLPVHDGKEVNRDDVFTAIGAYARFPNQKTASIMYALKNWDSKIKPLILNDLPDMSVANRRVNLIHAIRGFGDKAASHFMRNTGLMAGCDALSIIDTHILKALEALNFQHGDYVYSERSFQRFTELVMAPPLLLDAVLWCAYADNWDLSQSDFDNFGNDKLYPVTVTITPMQQ